MIIAVLHLSVCVCACVCLFVCTGFAQI
uniref:Uncharacterized protein n=1 Tax=Anguilla anguilla TaxID=7936 RepID=A0A0E9R9N2_ANGAN